MSKKNQGIPGNSVEEAAQFNRELVKKALSMLEVERWIRTQARHDVYIEAIKVMVKDDEGDNILLVMTASNPSTGNNDHSCASSLPG